MSRLMQSLGFVIASILLGGLLGGLAGREIGRSSPSFVWNLVGPGSLNRPPPKFNTAEFGLGLGSVCGLLLGAAIGTILAIVHALRDAWMARSDLAKRLMADRRLD